MLIEILVLIFTCVINLSLGLFILLRNTKLLSNISFFLVAINVSAWAVANFLTEAAPTLAANSLFNRLAYLFGLLSLAFVVVFSYNFPRRSKVSRTVSSIFILFVCLMSVLSLTPLVAGQVSRGEEGLQFSQGSLAPLYLATLLVFLLISAAKFLQSRKKSNAQTRRQITLVLTGFLASGILGVATNLVLPSIFENFETAKLGPFLSVILVGTTTYAIVKHGLFNIKLVIARSIAYLAFISTFVGIYSLAVFGIANRFIAGDSFIATEVVPISVALFLVATAPYLKRFFDRVTNTLFYRDAYDPQTFLDELNKTIVGNIEIGILLRHTAKVIEENIKAECHIYIRKTETTDARIMGTSNLRLKPHDIEVIREELLTINRKTVVTDELEDHYLILKETLDDNEIAVISSLVTSYAANLEATAYLMLGPKKSGNTYSRQDIRIISIIADELLIATQNARRFEEIQSFNITLQNRINDATAKIKRSNEKLKELDETKDEFISMASHQLRTPLTSVKGYLSMVLDGDAGKVPENQRQLLNQAFVSSQRMVYLIADLLNMSRLKTGKFIIDSSPTNLSDMVEGELAQLNEVAKSRKLTLNFEKPDNFPELMLDETKTRQVVMNFVDNAIYYTPGGGKIKIELTTDRSSVYFMVKDNGLGVPKDEQAHMFTKFYRAKNAQKARPDGTGLGLYMAKKVITDQGGTILFESVENKGSTFGFKFDKPKPKDE